MVERESGPTEDGGPVAPPIPSFESLRAPRRRSAIDLLLSPLEIPTEPPVETRVEDVPVEVATPVPAAPPVEVPAAPPIEGPVAAASPVAPRPAEWGDLLHLGTRLGVCAVRLVADGASRGLAGVRSLLRG
ncbi:hypothetical protein [Trujillonella endophytica]|uniref:Uncharacterized protein n=1 Tax=Trujillonella endophytica TaxID=673521 RepID=A0A1H8Q2M0_9ACTN|nr:hypothetical protein [Trujillella endophytica]SEO48157.1 hypothetical protein SAMN05660991_00519 [Trujillella endophytica]